MIKSRVVDALTVIVAISVLETAVLPDEADAAARRVDRSQPVNSTQSAPINTPNCASLEHIASEIDAANPQPINLWVEPSARGGLTLAAGVETPGFDQAFGKPLLNWSRDDLRIFNPAVNSCMKTAMKEKRFDAQKRLIELRRVVQFHISQPLNTVNRARQDVAVNLEKLNALSASVEKLKVVVLLGRLGNLSRSEGAREVRMPIEQMRHIAATPGRLVAASIQNLPQKEADRYFSEIDGIRKTLTEEVLVDLELQMANAPESIAGLVAIDTIAKVVSSDLSGIAPQERMKKLTGEADRHSERIWVQLEKKIAAVADNELGSQALNAMTGSAEYRQLGAQDQKRLNQLVMARREQVAGAAVTGIIEKLESFPATLDGLGQLVAFAAEERRRLGRQYVPGARQSFDDAYHSAHQSRINAVEKEFEGFLENLPVSRAGVGQIKQTLRAIDAPAKSKLYRDGADRARQIFTSVTRAEREQQCLKALPDMELDDDDAMQNVMGFGGEALVLGDLLCDIALAGNQVHGFESPGFFGEDYRLEITERDGIFRTYIFNLAPVGPDKEALVGVKVINPTSEKALDVSQWRAVLAQLLPNNKARKKARCKVLMAKPESKLSANEKIEAMGCIMGSLLGQ